MKETVLYYTPQPTKQSRTLKGILVRIGDPDPQHFPAAGEPDRRNARRSAGL